MLLLEAGDEETKSSLLDIPLTSYDHQQTALDWSYLIEPQENATLSFTNQVSKLVIHISKLKSFKPKLRPDAGSINFYELKYFLTESEIFMKMEDKCLK